MEIAQMKYLGGSYWQMLSIIFVYLNLFRVFVFTFLKENMRGVTHCLERDVSAG